MGETMRLWGFGLVLWALGLAGPQGAAAAGLEDCHGSAFQSALHLSPGFSFDCAELAQTASPVGGDWVIRALRNATTDEAFVKPYAEEAVDVIATAFSAWEPYAAQMGFEFGHVSVVLSDPLGAEFSFDTVVHGLGKFEGYANAQAFALPRECVVRVNMKFAAVGSYDYLRKALAHEAFHCVQGWSFPSEALGGAGGASWWIEGTANFFAGLVHEDQQALAALGVQFAQSIGTKPLTQQAYASVPFFAYLWQQGPGVMASFFKGLSDQPNELAQMMATEAAVGKERLQGFAEAMVDGKVAMPSGFEFPGLPEPDTQTFDGDGQIATSTTPFTIEAKTLHFVGGDYTVVGAARFRSRDQAGGDWQDLPQQISPETCGDVVMLRAARFVGWQPGATLGVPHTVTRITECWKCNQLAEADQCLPGKWKLDSADLLAFLQKVNKNTAEISYGSVAGQVFLVLEPGGKGHWVLEGVEIGATYAPKELMGMEIEIDVGADGIASGAWSSAGGGQMHFCAEAVDMEYVSRVRVPGMDEDEVKDKPGLEDYDLGYSCTDTGLTLTYNGPLAVTDPPVWNFDRIK